jgi:hypothetical protein
MVSNQYISGTFESLLAAISINDERGDENPAWRPSHWGREKIGRLPSFADSVISSGILNPRIFKPRNMATGRVVV